jgi:hypothetical protein
MEFWEIGHTLLSLLQLVRHVISAISGSDFLFPHLVQTQPPALSIGEEALQHAEAAVLRQLGQFGFGEVMNVTQALSTLPPIQ